MKTNNIITGIKDIINEVKVKRGVNVVTSRLVNRLAQAVLDCVSGELVLRVVVIDPTNVASTYLGIVEGLGVSLSEFINYIIDHELMHYTLTRRIVGFVNCIDAVNGPISLLITGCEEALIDLELARKYPWLREYSCSMGLKPMMPGPIDPVILRAVDYVFEEMPELAGLSDYETALLIVMIGQYPEVFAWNMAVMARTRLCNGRDVEETPLLRALKILAPNNEEQMINCANKAIRIRAMALNIKANKDV